MQTAIVFLLLVLAAITLLILKLWWSWRHFYTLGDQIPGPKSIPLIGNLTHLLGDYSRKIKNISQDNITYGNIFRLYFGRYLVVFLTNPKDIQSILTNSKFFTRNEFFLFGLKAVLGEGLLTNAGEVWKRHRKIINPTFNNKVLEGFMDIFNENSYTMVKNLVRFANKSTFDVYQIVSLVSFDSAHETVLGISYDVQNNSDNPVASILTRSLEIISERIHKPWLYIGWIFNNTKMGKEHRDHMTTVNGLVDTTISLKLQEHRDRKLSKITGEGQSGKLRNLPFLELMITAGEMEGDLLSPLELRDEMVTLVVAGAETTAVTISFTLVLMSLYPKHQQQVVEELEVVFGDDPTRAVTTSDLKELHCLERVIKESLRLYPAIPLSPRNITEDVKLSSHTLPAGTVAFLNYFSMMRDPELYPDPLNFDPDRFLPEAVSQRPSTNFIPFGLGLRMCIGYKYAMMQMKVVLAHVLRSYEVLPACTREDIEDLEIGIVMRPVGGFKIRLKPRANRTAA